MATRKKKKASGRGVMNKAKVKSTKGTGSNLFESYTTLGKDLIYKIKEGVVRLDMLPYEVTKNNHPQGVEEGDFWYVRPFGIHRNVGPEEKTVVCPKITFNQPCPICEEYKHRLRDDEADETITKSLRPKDRQLFVVMTEDDEIKVMDSSYHLFGKLLESELEAEDDYQGFASIDEDGKTLKIRFKEKDTPFGTCTEATRIDFEDRDPIEEDILDDVPALDEVFKMYSYEDLDAMFNGTNSASTDKEEAAEAEEAPRKRRTRKKAKVVEPEEEEDEEEEEIPAPRKRRSRKAKVVEPEEEDDEEEEVPAPRKRRSRKAKPEPEPEPEEDDDDEEEEEEAPAPKKRRTRKAKVVEPEPEEEEDDEEEEEIPKPTPKKRRTRKAKLVEPEPEEDDEEEEAPKPKKRATKKKVVAKVVEEEDEDDEDFWDD